MIGRTLSCYEITAKLGAGAMGEVWHATDTRLDREVALKVLPEELATDPERLERFEREAKAIAALNHPNIVTIYSVEESDGVHLLTMELVEGETLDRILPAGGFDLERLFPLAIQIADALAAAHEKGIVHRDLKPANVMVTDGGRVKVLDFGLAKLAKTEDEAEDTQLMTQAGMILGTVPYMSPEQVQAKPVDHRSDIFSLGILLYEMATGQRPFQGDNAASVISAVLKEQPAAVTQLKAELPNHLGRIVRRCLEKPPLRRYQSAREIQLELEGLESELRLAEGARIPVSLKIHGAEPSPEANAPVHGIPGVRSIGRWVAALGDAGRQRLVLGAAAVTAATMAALAALAFLHLTEAPAERPLSKWSFAPAELEPGSQPVAVSPNGRHIVYEAGPGIPRLWVRDLDRLEPRELVGTEGATRPFWSPDSRFIGFAAGGELKKISVQGGIPISLCPLAGAQGQPSSGDLWGGSWSPDGESIAFSSAESGGARVFEVPARSGHPKLLFEPQEPGLGSSNSHPHFLPAEAGARSVLLRVRGETDLEIAVKNLETGSSVSLASGEHPVFSPSGHIIYDHQNSLWAIPFSLDTLEATGAPFPIAENSRSASVTSDGTLVSLLGSDDALRIGGGLRQLVWRNSEGAVLGELGPAQGGIRSPALSPNGNSVAVEAWEGGSYDQSVWVHEVGRLLKRRLTLGARSGVLPQWSPSGREITYGSYPSWSEPIPSKPWSQNPGSPGIEDFESAPSWDIFRRPADGTGEPELLVGTEADELPYGWSRDEKYLVYVSSTGGNSDLWYLKRTGDGGDFESEPFLATPFAETEPNLSPNGDLLAYCSDHSGKEEVYVRPFPSGAGQTQVSTLGGCQPRWSRDGKQLFYVEGDNLVEVEVGVGPRFVVGESRTLFSSRNLRRGYDVSADGRFLMVDPVESPNAAPAILVVENWYEEFRDRGQD
jgi:Tol biopolymer transport system component